MEAGVHAEPESEAFAQWLVADAAAGIPPATIARVHQMAADEIANPYQETSSENGYCDRDCPTLPERSDASGNANDKAEDRLREAGPTVQPTCATSPASQSTTECSSE
jgi:hypothetical protein